MGDVLELIFRAMNSTEQADRGPVWLPGKTLDQPSQRCQRHLGPPTLEIPSTPGLPSKP